MHPAASRPHTRFILALTAILLLGLAVPVWPAAQVPFPFRLPRDDPDDRATLKGIAAIQVVVEDLNPDAERDGLTRDHLQTDMELRLRKAGIRVTSKHEEAGGSYLYLNVSAVKHNALSVYGYHIRLEFYQRVALARDPRVRTDAVTWISGSTGVVSAQRLRSLRDNVADKVDKFINAYLEQNPKP